MLSLVTWRILQRRVYWSCLNACLCIYFMHAYMIGRCVCVIGLHHIADDQESWQMPAFQVHGFVQGSSPCSFLLRSGWYLMVQPSKRAQKFYLGQTCSMNLFYLMYIFPCTKNMYIVMLSKSNSRNIGKHLFSVSFLERMKAVGNRCNSELK